MHLITCKCAPGCRARGERAAEVLQDAKHDADTRDGYFKESSVMRYVRERYGQLIGRYL